MATMTAKARGTRLLVSLAVLSSVASCQRYRLMRDCSEVSSLVNTALQGIGGKQKGTLDELPLEKAESVYRSLSTELSRLEVDDKALAALVRTHRGLLSRASRTLRALRKAQKRKGGDSEVDRHVKTLAQLHGSAAASEAQLNRHCHQRF